MTFAESLACIALATALLLLIPLVAMQFSTEVTWTLLDFGVAGGLLFGAGLAYVLVARLGHGRTYRVAVGVAVAAGLLLVWANLAVGLVSSPHNPTNLLYGGVLVVALTGALGARFRPLGMARAMFAAAFTYALVTAIALLAWAAPAEPAVAIGNVLLVNAMLAALWVVAGELFRRVGSAGPVG